MQKFCEIMYNDTFSVKRLRISFIFVNIFFHFASKKHGEMNLGTDKNKAGFVGNIAY